MSNDILQAGQQQVVTAEVALTAIALGLGELVNAMLRIADVLEARDEI
jgi:hypothetical protein